MRILKKKKHQVEIGKRRSQENISIHGKVESLPDSR
jgi:hypothetical protein